MPWLLFFDKPTYLGIVRGKKQGLQNRLLSEVGYPIWNHEWILRDFQWMVFYFLGGQFCDVAKVAVIHNKI
jgi:hypothetical protein